MLKEDDGDHSVSYFWPVVFRFASSLVNMFSLKGESRTDKRPVNFLLDMFSEY